MVGKGRELDWSFDALGAFARWPGDRPAVFLHSGRVEQRWARYSVLAEPVGYYQLLDHTTEQRAHPGHRIGQSKWIGHHPCPVSSLTHAPFSDLRALLDAPGIWIGYLSYDLGRWIEKLPSYAEADRNWPIIELGYCPGWLTWDGVEHAWSAHGAWADDPACIPDLINAPDVAIQADNPPYQCGEPQSVFSRGAYEQAVSTALEYIGAGDVFQVNLAQRFSAEFDGAFPLAQRALFNTLATGSPAWYGAYLELGRRTENAGGKEPQRVIASTSPELFLEVDAEHKVVTRPIKGTRPACVDPGILRESEKDCAELNMIVDLMRNDLGRVCEYGSVRVKDGRAIESHPTVHHGVATIDGKLADSKDIVDLLRATMPGGSVTGAPKVRTMEIIDELEPVRRGPYCGCIGMLSAEHSCLNIAIRTMLIESSGAEQRSDQKGGRVDFSVGGGIVADSDPASEYEETLDKAEAMLSALGVQRPNSMVRT